MEVLERSNYQKKVIFELELCKGRGGNNILDQGLANFSIRGQIINNFSFVTILSLSQLLSFTFVVQKQP